MHFVASPEIRASSGAMPTNTPHDALFKSAFTIPENAAAELRHLLPPEIVRLIDLDSLVLVPGSFVRQDLAARHADVLFSARMLAHEIQIYVLSEHESEPDRWLLLYMNGYMQHFWERFIADNPRATHLPIILPIVVAHGDGGWRRSNRFEAMFVIPPAAEALRVFVPQFSIAIDDLTSQPEEAILRREAPPFAVLTLLALQQARRTHNVRQMLRAWRSQLRTLRRRPGGRRARDKILGYIALVCGIDALDAIDLTVQESDPDTEEAMETIAEHFERRGREKGLEEGLKKGQQQGQRGLLVGLLRRRFGALPAKYLRRLKQADGDTLERLASRLFDASSIDDVFA